MTDSQVPGRVALEALAESPDRRRLVAGLGAFFAAALAGISVEPVAAVTQSSVGPESGPAAGPEGAPLPPERPNEDPLLRMQRDLQRALAKPIDQRRWGMVIDLRKCVGCKACTIACKAENHLPPGVVYRPVIEEEIGTYPNISRRFIPRPCMQCEQPPCVPVCPVGATYRRPDGIVEINYDQCIGCRYCMTACPYQARVFDSGDFYTADTPGPTQPFELLPTRENGRSYDRTRGGSPVGNVRKCTFCSHRLEYGMLPECVTTCIGVATYFGDLNDPESLVARLSSQPNVMRLKEELGTQPRVFYLT